MNDNNRKYTSLKDLSFGFSEQDGWLGGVSEDDPNGEQHTDSFASDQGNASFSHSDVLPENDPYRSAAQDQNACPPEMPYNAPVRPSAAKNKAFQTDPAPADAKRFFYTFLVFSTVNFALPLFFKEFWVLIPYLFQIISGAAVYVISTAENKKKNLQPEQMAYIEQYVDSMEMTIQSDHFTGVRVDGDACERLRLEKRIACLRGKQFFLRERDAVFDDVVPDCNGIICVLFAVGFNFEHVFHHFLLEEYIKNAVV